MRPWRIFRGWLGTAVLVGCAVVSVLLVVFVAQNFIIVEVRLLRWEINVRLAWALVLASAIGFGIGVLAARATSR